MFHGTQHIDLQIVNALNVFQTLPSIVNNISEDSQVYKFVCNMRKRQPKKQLQFSLYQCLGKGYDKDLSVEEYK